MLGLPRHRRDGIFAGGDALAAFGFCALDPFLSPFALPLALRLRFGGSSSIGIAPVVRAASFIVFILLRA